MIAPYGVFKTPEESHPCTGVHLPPVTASPLADPPLEPWESCASNETGFPAHSIAVSLRPRLLSHLLRPFADVMGIPMVIVDLRLRNKEIVNT
jgi:hypothetical protein